MPFITEVDSIITWSKMFPETKEMYRVVKYAACGLYMESKTEMDKNGGSSIN